MLTDEQITEWNKRLLDCNCFYPEQYAEINALCDQAKAANPKGIVMVPESAMNWLFGMGKNFECDPAKYWRGKPPQFWWRSEFRKRIEEGLKALRGEAR